MIGGAPFGPRMIERYAEENLYGVGGLVHQGLSAEIIAAKWKLSRRELDELSLASHQKAAAATRNGWFDNEIVPIEIAAADGGKASRSRPTRASAPTRRWRSSARCKPAFKTDGVITAGNSSQITDGAAAVLVMEKEKARALGLRPRARFHSFALGGVDPVIMLTGVIPATQQDPRALEASASATSTPSRSTRRSRRWCWPGRSEFDPDLDKVNQHGGAIALGHPLGCSGARLMTTLLNTLERTGGRYGLQTMCEGGGMANATVIERLD